eukprot:8550110-Pyramimonas_sp.AAC.1
MHARPKLEVTWTEQTGLMDKQREQAAMAAERLIVRRELGQAEATSVKIDNRAGNKKQKASSTTRSPPRWTRERHRAAAELPGTREKKALIWQEH